VKAAFSKTALVRGNWALSSKSELPPLAGSLESANPTLIPAYAGFVGRARELAEVRSAIDNALSGRGQMLLFSGEPGIGKTRLADQSGLLAESRGMRVVWGRCWEGEGAPSYWPWIQIIRTLAQGWRERFQTAERMADVIDRVAQIVPELRGSAAPVFERPAPRVSPEETRFLMFEAAGSLIREFARTKPLLLIIDDLHDADPSSLMMLRFAARELRSFPILIVGTYREQEVRRSPELAQMIGSILREGASLPLSGFSKQEIALLAEHTSGRKLGDALIAELHRVTSGNPLFAEGVLRMVGSRPDLGLGTADLSALNLPDGVREVIRSRIAMLPKEATAVLPVAAAIGNEFALQVLELASELSSEDLVTAVAQASQSGLLVRIPGTPERYRFSHALIRSGLYETIMPAFRPVLHRKIGQALECIYGAAAELAKNNASPINSPAVVQGPLYVHATELAYHFREAARGGDPAKAIDYSVRAGDAARAAFGHEDAMKHWQSALNLMSGRNPEPGERASLLARMGEVTFYYLDKEPKTRSAYLEQAIDLYEELGRLEDAARLHLILASARPGFAIPDQSLAEHHLRRAQIALSSIPKSAAAVSLQMNLADTAMQAVRLDEGLAMSERALNSAEQIGERKLLISATICRANTLFYTGNVGASFALSRQAYKVAEAGNDLDMRLRTALDLGMHAYLLHDNAESCHWLLGKITEADLEQAPAARQLLLDRLVAVRSHRGELGWAREIMAGSGRSPAGNRGPFLHALSLWQGEWEKFAEQHTQFCQHAREQGYGIWAGGVEADLSFVFSLIGSRSRMDRFVADAQLLGRSSGLMPFELEMRANLATFDLETQRVDDALRHLERCREIRADGEDWRGTGALVDRAEGMLAATLRDYEATERWFKQSAEVLNRGADVFYEAETLYYWGRALAGLGERARSEEKLAAATEIYRRHEAGSRFIERVQSAKGESNSALSMPPDKSVRETASLIKQGDYWTITFRSQTSRLKATRGLNYIGHLLRHPGREFFARELVDAIGNYRVIAPLGNEQDQVAANLGDSGPLLDTQAKAEYTARLADLGAELEEAEQMNDIGRAERVRHEMDAITDHLSAAIGLGGRDRRASSHSERARWMVTKRIKADLKRIANSHPALGRILERTIRTGTICAYLPDPDQPITWTL
jgi:tetratricopeptide (TPR) repeat protein